MRRRSLFAAAALVFCHLTARADSFTFSFGTSASAFSGSGSLTTSTLLAPTQYLIGSVTGSAVTTVGGPSISIQSILAPNSFPTPTNGGTFPPNDNNLFVFNGVGTLSQYGLSFLLSDGEQINLYNGGTGGAAFLERANGTTLSEAAPITITATTPEPSSLLLLGTGLLGIGGGLKRRQA